MGGKVKNNISDKRPYKVYTALLNQSGTDAPVATVLENTLGEITITREGIGVYLMTSVGNLKYNKRFIYKGLLKSIDSINGSVLEGDEIFGSNNQIQLFCKDMSGVFQDGLSNFPIEIRVYN